RWRLAELTVNYRTPGEIMALAAPVLAAIDPRLSPPSSVRETGVLPWVTQVTRRADVPGAVAAATAESAAETTAARLAVLYRGGETEGRALADAGLGRVRDVATEAGPGLRVVVLDVLRAKGLEFDRVIVVEPGDIAPRGDHGLGDL